MTTFPFRSRWLAALLPAACVWLGGACGAGPDLSTTGTGGVIGVPIDLATNTDVAIASVAVSKGVVYGTRGVGGNGSQTPQVFRIDFDPPGLVVLPVGAAFAQSGDAPEIGVTTDAFAWIACSGGSPECKYQIGTGAATDAGSPSTFSRSGDAMSEAPMALVVDDAALYVALVSSSQTGPGGSPDESYWPGTSAGGLGPASGDMIRVARADGAVQSAGMSQSTGPGFAFQYARHLIAQDARYVYTVTNESQAAGPVPVDVVRIEKSSWTAGPSKVAAIVNDPSMGVVGLAARGSTVAWTAARTPSGGASGCEIGAVQTDGDGGVAAPRTLLQSGSYDCWGLALDDTHAYFTVVHAASDPENGGGTFVVGTRIGRVPLAGGSPEFVDVGASKYYGPRRVLVDDTYVYGIDPRVVLRFRKDVAWLAQ